MTVGSRLFKDRAAESVIRDAWKYEFEQRDTDEALLAELALSEEVEARIRAHLGASRIGYISLMVEGVLYDPAEEDYLLRQLPEIMAGERSVSAADIQRAHTRVAARLGDVISEGGDSVATSLEPEY